MTFTVVASEREGFTAIALTGDFDLSAIERFERAVADIRPLSLPLVIDMTSVTFMDSSGTRALLMAREATLEDVGETAHLAGIPPTIRRVVDLMGLDQSFVIDD